ncbi:hypothetical protein AT05_07890 [Schleiferia thermophila str. Yellowstone]|nr:hypothetical protein AT05_07890 [Schleiferia thermophila str. Yellowstone]
MHLNISLYSLFSFFTLLRGLQTGCPSPAHIPETGSHPHRPLALVEARRLRPASEDYCPSIRRLLAS